MLFPLHRVRLFLFSLFILSTGISAAHAQVAPAMQGRGLPLTVGGGISTYNSDFGPSSRMIGLSGWADYRIWHGLSLDAEVHGIDFHPPTGIPNFKENSVEGGVLYRTRSYYGIHPYAKFLIGYGSVHFGDDPYYDHDSRTIYSPGGGIELPFTHHLAAKVDYEYQFWPNLFGTNSALTPNGFTFGASWNFRGFRDRAFHSEHRQEYAPYAAPAPPLPQQ